MINGEATEIVVMTMEVVQNARKITQLCVRHDGVLIKWIIAAVQALMGVMNTTEWARDYVVGFPPTFYESYSLLYFKII